MEKTIEQVEKNVSASFGYVKKDMLMLNDSFSDLHDKVQHLSMNHAMLLEEIGKLRQELAKISGKEIPTSKKKAIVEKVPKKAPAKKKSTKKATSKKKAIKKVVKETTVYE